MSPTHTPIFRYLLLGFERTGRGWLSWGQLVWPAQTPLTAAPDPPHLPPTSKLSFNLLASLRCRRRRRQSSPSFYNFSTGPAPARDTVIKHTSGQPGQPPSTTATSPLPPHYLSCGGSYHSMGTGHTPHGLQPLGGGEPSPGGLASLGKAGQAGALTGPRQQEEVRQGWVVVDGYTPHHSVTSVIRQAKVCMGQLQLGANRPTTPGACSCYAPGKGLWGLLGWRPGLFPGRPQGF
ncbi:hypothetical protein Cadr_000012036 [Camelus dromedarius]|uniref:Uncharacterized protein n=1 Tax=Camelus dromedarius TaxID=9838 RepID=A0A5N4DPX4_CAMDR|nr:hypothetical protein Cadr_000012036 [Camelus dromedarius]